MYNNILPDATSSIFCYDVLTHPSCHVKRSHFQGYAKKSSPLTSRQCCWFPNRVSSIRRNSVRHQPLNSQARLHLAARTTTSLYSNATINSARKTQHLLVVTRARKLSTTTGATWRQIRTCSARYTSETLTRRRRLRDLMVVEYMLRAGRMRDVFPTFPDKESVGAAKTTRFSNRESIFQIRKADSNMKFME